MAINVLGALNTEINTIWKFGIKKFWTFLLPLFQKENILTFILEFGGHATKV